MVILRLSLGCHFLYEGVWKIAHPEFSADSFLRQAKGPVAWIFHAMVPDMFGRDRLKVESVLRSDPISDAWAEARIEAEKVFVQKLVNAEKVKKAEELPEERKKAIRQFRIDADKLLWEAEDQLESAVSRHEESVLAYFASRDEDVPADKKVFKKKELPADIKALLDVLAEVEQKYHKGLAQLTTSATGGKAPEFAAVVPPLGKKVTSDRIVNGTTITSAAGNEILSIEEGIKGSCYVEAFTELWQEAVDRYDVKDNQAYDIEKLYRVYKASVREYLDMNLDDIVGYHGSLDRLEALRSGGNNGAAHQKQRMWEEDFKLRGEVDKWLGDLDQVEQDFRVALWEKLTPEQKEVGPLPESWTQMDLVNFAVTYGLTAIGLCLLLGLFSRPAAIGGGCFMFFVILTQPAWPTIYPPAPPVAGHALLINKDFVEMVALFLLATTAAGRWAGLDYFVENYLIRCYETCKCRMQKKGKEGGAKDESKS